MDLVSVSFGVGQDARVTLSALRVPAHVHGRWVHPEPADLFL